jgi:prenylcysteine oxidase/farnesylcysteine lyase
MFAGSQVEFGAAFIHSTNQLLSSLLDSLQLEKCPSRHSAHGARFTLGIWNGSQFVLRLPASGLLKYPGLALRYGISLVKLRRSIKNVLKQWGRLYDSQLSECVFADPKELFGSVGLLEATNQIAGAFWARQGVSSLVREELCCAIVRAIFSQNLSINAFAGFAALVAAGIAGGTAFSISGGNQRLCQELLSASQARLFTGRAIAAIHSTSGGGSTIVDDRGISSTFDSIIVSAPLHESRIALNLATPPKCSLNREEWLTVTETCVAGRLSSAFFGLGPQAIVPDLVLTIDETTNPFSAIRLVSTQQYTQDSGRQLYKISSVRPLEKRLLNDLFLNIDDVASATWCAYPRLEPKAESVPFRIGQGLYYINSIEDIVSTLETEVLASRNVVRLMRRDLSRAI